MIMFASVFTLDARPNNHIILSNSNNAHTHVSTHHEKHASHIGVYGTVASGFGTNLIQSLTGNNVDYIQATNNDGSDSDSAATAVCRPLVFSSFFVLIALLAALSRCQRELAVLLACAVRCCWKITFMNIIYMSGDLRTSGNPL